MRTTSNIADTHQNTAEKDASWNRFNLHFRTDSGVTTNTFPDNVVLNGVTGSVPSEGADADGFSAIGGFRSAAAGTTLTMTFVSSAAAEVGLYIELSGRTEANMVNFDTYWVTTVNGTTVPVSNFPLALIPEGGTSNAASNVYLFLGYVNVTAGTNTIVFTKTDAANPTSGGLFNFYAIRISAQSATISLPAPAPAPAA